MKKALSIILACLLLLGLVACGNGGGGGGNVVTDPPRVSDTAPPTQAAKTYTIANLPKSVGGPWFNRMAQAMGDWAKETGHDFYQTGPEKADPALQVKEIEDMIVQGVDILVVVPSSPESQYPGQTKA